MSDLLAATLDREGIERLVWNREQSPELADAAELRPFRIDPATPAAAVVVDAPAVRANHRQIKGALIIVESSQRFGALVRCEPATGAALADATPRLESLIHLSSCDKPSQRTC